MPLTTNEYTATGGTANFTLNYAPVIGKNLMVVNNTGTSFISGTFSNLSQGQTVLLIYNNVGYEYLANYYGGTGNDLVLVWAKNRAFAWGWNDSGQIGDNSITVRTVPVTVRATGVLAGRTITAFAAGESHSLALCSDGTVAAWGLNSEGQLGNNTTSDSRVPVAVNTASGVSALYGKMVVAIAAGRYFSMALCSDGTVATWGSNNNGELGDATTTNRKVPVAVNAASGVSDLHGKTVTAIAAGAHHSVASCSDGTVVAWGYNYYGQLGNNTPFSYYVPVAVNTASGVSALYGKTVVALAAGFYHTLALCSDGSMASWGCNLYGGLGDNTTTNRKVPVAVNAASGVSSLYGKSIVAIAAGGYHDLALCSDGTLLAWGSNGSGQLGDNSFTNRNVPVEVNTANGVSALYGKTLVAPACGTYHSAVQCSDGTVAIWGSNEQLGNNAPNSSNVPVMPSSSPLDPGENFSQVASGSSARHTLALAAAPPAAPAVTGLAPTSITTTSVTLNGTVNGNNSPTAVSFDYGTTTAYGTNLAATPASIISSTPTAVSVSLTGLTPGTTYHFRVNGVSGVGTSHGGDLIFTTLSTNAGLSGLVLSNGTLSPVFDTGTTSYTAAVTFPVTSVTLRPTLANAGASVTVNGVSITAGYASNPISLNEGDNTLTTVVTAQDGTTTQTYTVTVNLAPLPVWNAQGDVPLAINGLTATGLTLELPALNFAPAVGASLMVVNNTGIGFIQGTFDNLSQGQAVALVFNGVTYNYVASYYGGTGNDLVLLWAERHLVAWGANSAGELGNNATVSRRAPVAVMTEGTPLALAAGAYHSVALFADGSLSSWGGNDAGQLGNGTLTNSSVPGPVTTVGTPLEGKVIAAIAAGAIHNLALCTDGTMAAWGDNGDGQLGAFFLPGGSSVPVEVLTAFSPLQSQSVVAISAGSFHSLVLCADGTLVAWGRNYHGALGNGTTDSSVFPGAVTTAGTPLAGRSVVAMAAGGYHNIALCSDNTVVTWGDNDYGQLGNSTNTSSSVPVAVTTAGTVLEGKTVIAVAAGLYHCVAWCSDGTLAAWGQNEYGQLGNNSAANSNVPVAVDLSGVLAGKTVSEMTAGASFSLVRCTDGTAVSWGFNANGQLGNNSLTNSSTPVLVAAGKSFMGVVAGSCAYHTLGQVVTPFPVFSSDATLSGLAVSPGALNTPYDSSTSSYLVVLDSTVTSITLTPTVNESHASITVNGQAVASGTATSAIPLVTGVRGNPIQVTVTAQDGYSQAQYVVFVACLSKVEQWRLQAFGAPFDSGSAADTADADNDGICNLLEFALNLSPTTASKLPVSTAINGGNYEYTYTRSTTAANAGTTFTVEWNATLSAASWSSSGVTQTVLSDDGTTQQVKAVIPMNGASTIFVHLSVTAPP